MVKGVGRGEKGQRGGGRGAERERDKERQERSCEEKLASSLSFVNNRKTGAPSILLYNPFVQILRVCEGGGGGGGRDLGGRERSGGQWRQQRLWNGKEGVFPLHLLLPPLPAAAMLFLSSFCES